MDAKGFKVDMIRSVICSLTAYNVKTGFINGVTMESDVSAEGDFLGWCLPQMLCHHHVLHHLWAVLLHSCHLQVLIIEMPNYSVTQFIMTPPHVICEDCFFYHCTWEADSLKPTLYVDRCDNPFHFPTDSFKRCTKAVRYFSEVYVTRGRCCWLCSGICRWARTGLNTAHSRPSAPKEHNKMKLSNSPQGFPKYKLKPNSIYYI